jgi:hypothetical protein
MITLCICYTLDHNKLADFETYARSWAKPVARHGGELLGYFLPTKIAGSTNTALALIGFPNLTVYEQYRDGLMTDPEVIANVRQVEASGCILNEDRSFVRRVD